MRKLAREAVIFMLLGMLLTAAGESLYEHHSQWTDIRAQRAVLKKDCNKLFGRSPDADIFDRAAAKSGAVGDIDSATGEYISRAECASVFGASLYPPPDFIPVPDPNQRQSEITALAEAARIKNLAVNNGQIALEALFLAPFGFLGGLGVWLFYRLIRFAVTG